MSQFQVFISSVASRLRHDLKGGLISLRLGLDAISDEEALKPLLVEKAQAMETLADKLILLLRMGELRPASHRLSALLGETRRRVGERNGELQLEFTCDEEARWEVDGDALIYALCELAENSMLAGASKVTLEVEGDTISLQDDGSGPQLEAEETLGRLCEVGLSRWERSGIGLSIAQQCAVGHGGDLTLSQPETGGFRVELRFAGAAE